MARYDLAYERLAQRAIKQGAVDVETLMQMAKDNGMTQARLEELLLQDLEEGGPIFGKFVRSMTSAANTAVQTAARQGQALADIANSISDKEIAEFMSVGDIDNLAYDAAPDAIDQAIGAEENDLLLTWKATLVNTCNLCLPLHGKTMYKSQWEAQSLSPEVIHLQEGWESDCQCNLVRAAEFSRSKEVDPLIRKKYPKEAGKVNKRTMRSVLQEDLGKSYQAISKAADTPEGRRTLRLLGQSNG